MNSSHIIAAYCFCWLKNLVSVSLFLVMSALGTHRATNFGWRTDDKIVLRWGGWHLIYSPEPSFSIWSSLWSLSLSFFWGFQLNFSDISWATRNRSLQKAEEQIPITLPVPFKITHIGDYWRPVKGPRLLLQPLLQLPKVLVCVVTDNDLLEGLTGRQKLIDGGTRANVNQEVSLHTTWNRRGRDQAS